MKEIKLNNLNLKTLTEQDILDYCQLNNINSDNIIILNLQDSEFTDISGIKLFKNLETLFIGYNKIKDISVIKDLINLKILGIEDLNLNSSQINHINSCKNLKKLYCYNGFKDMFILQKIKILIQNIKLNI